MKIKELREKSADELKKMLTEEQAKVCQLRFDMSARQVKNYRELSGVRKNIARIMTILKNQELTK